MPYRWASWLHWVFRKWWPGLPAAVPALTCIGVCMAVMLDCSQRDAVYQFVLLDLIGVGNMPSLMRRGKVEQACGLRQRFEQDMQLLDQIGWGPKGGKEVYAITLASDDIRAIFRRLLARATLVINEAVTEFANQVLTEASCVAETSRIVLGELPRGAR